MLTSDYRMIAMALDVFVNEYDGAAPEKEIERAQELADHFWAKTAKAEYIQNTWRAKRKA